jgi:hypothetical protein
VGLTLPLASTCPGRIYYVKNSGSNLVGIYPTGGDTIDGQIYIHLDPKFVLSVNGVFPCICLMSDGVTSWRTISTIRENDFFGYNIANITLENSSHTVEDSDDIILIDTVSAPKTVLLPRASQSSHRVITIKNRAAFGSVNNLTITPYTGDFIEGQAPNTSIIVGQGANIGGGSVTLAVDPGYPGWWIVGSVGDVHIS